eukprot:971182-Pyramimonas_sp.AAC.1
MKQEGVGNALGFRPPPEKEGGGKAAPLLKQEGAESRLEPGNPKMPTFNDRWVRLRRDRSTMAIVEKK